MLSKLNGFPISSPEQMVPNVNTACASIRSLRIMQDCFVFLFYLCFLILMKNLEDSTNLHRITRKFGSPRSDFFCCNDTYTLKLMM